MFKFLFRKSKTDTPEVVIETDRESFDRLVSELNAMIDTLADKPRVTIDPATGHILPEMPETFPDEALALPAPEVESPEVVVTESAEATDPAEPEKAA